MTHWLDEVKFDANGLIPAIAQDKATGRILMVAWMNRESLAKTAELKQGVYFSRSRQKLWHKGEESGHFQDVHEVRLDCDSDVIVLQITQHGGIACHTGRESCFYKQLTPDGWVVVDAVKKDPNEIYEHPHSHTHRNQQPCAHGVTTEQTLQATEQLDVLAELGKVLESRKQADPSSSYVSSLFHKGLNKILEKVGEESTEMILSAKDATPEDTNDLVYETADLWFHSLIALSHFNVPPQAILDELARRFGLSGHEEKAQRSAQ